MMSEQSLLLANRQSQGAERSYTKIYERLRETIDREVADPAPARDWRRFCSLLAAEQRAWVHAYGSDSVEAAAALDGSARYPSALVEEAWIARQRSEFGNTPGAIHSKRPPGVHEVERFVVAADPARPGTVKPVNVRDALRLEGLNARYGLDHLLDQAWRFAPSMQPTHFLAVGCERAWFVMREPNSGERKVVGVGHLRTPGVAEELGALAMQPKDALRLLREVEREHLRGQVQARYEQRPLREVPRDVVVQGRVDSVLTDKQEQHALVLPPRAAVHHAVVVTPDAVHLVRVGAGEQAKKQAQQMVGEHVELSRSSEGMRLSLARGLDRAIGTLWAKAREEGLGR